MSIYLLKKEVFLYKKDILLLHGCCHNPSGADLSLPVWNEIAKLSQKNGFLPFIDIAYQGLGDGMDEDAHGLRKLVDNVEEVLISTSCSKNFGLYRERVGAAIVIGKDLQKARESRIFMGELARSSYSMPPSHGASIVREILTNPILMKEWNDELFQMRKRIKSLRKKLTNSFRIQTNSNRFDYINLHKGMFSMLELDNSQIKLLQKIYGIYQIGNRINIAGLQESEIDYFVSSIISVKY